MTPPFTQRRKEAGEIGVHARTDAWAGGVSLTQRFPFADLGNIVPFARTRTTSVDDGPASVVTVNDRPAPPSPPLSRKYFASLVILAAAVHCAALGAFFHQPPPPLASIGVESISVEIVLGAQTPAGRETTPSPSDIDSPASQERQENKESAQANDDDTTAPVANVEPDAPQESAPAAIGAPSPAETPPPAQAQAPPQTDDALLSPPETQQPVKQAEPPKPVAEPFAKPVTKSAPRNTEPSVGHSVKQGERKEAQPSPDKTSTAASNASAPASSSIGRGRSDKDSNYNGLVLAHLARYKQYPSEARSRGEKGRVAVTFGIDGQGRVTSVRISASSGFNSLDQEAQAMVRRASPFPPPPSGRTNSFTVPADFGLQGY